MAKAAALWNLTSQSTKAADAAFDIVGVRFSVPCATRWNSYCSSVKKIILCDEKKLTEVCKAVGLPPFIQSDLAFLKEYVSVMAPLATSLDILQGEQQCTLGYVLPTLSTLKKKLNIIDLKYTQPLCDSLLQGISKRFEAVFNDKEFLMAAITYPRFKLSWTDDADMRACGTQQLESALAASVMSGSDDTDNKGQEQTIEQLSAGDDFFDFDNCQPDHEQKHLAFLNDKGKELSMLYRHVEIKQLFLRYNTTLPSSAPVERLFSAGALILTKKRNRLSDELFETLLLLKVNKTFTVDHRAGK